MITGLIVGGLFFGNHLRYWWYLQNVGLYIVLHIVRFVFLLLVTPILKMTGYDFSVKQSALVAYGGLRGAVGLALALIVTHSRVICDENCGEDEVGNQKHNALKEMTIFHIAGIVLLTLVVNGTTTGFVIGWLGLKRESKTA